MEIGMKVNGFLELKLEVEKEFSINYLDKYMMAHLLITYILEMVR